MSGPSFIGTPVLTGHQRRAPPVLRYCTDPPGSAATALASEYSVQFCSLRIITFFLVLLFLSVHLLTSSKTGIHSVSPFLTIISLVKNGT